MQIKTSITLENAFMLSPQVKHFIFKADLQPPFHFLPGQFITIHFLQDNKLLKRSYSLANAPLQDNRIEFAASRVPQGAGTELLFNLKLGDKISISGPYGRLILKEKLPKRYILVATSTGVTPYRSMLQELKQRLLLNTSLQVVLIQGVQTPADILYLEDFLKFANNHHPQVNFYVYLSRTTTSLKNYEHTGYVQHAFPHLLLNPSQDLIYLCGNPGMIDESFSYLKNNGFAMQQIVREKYISTSSKILT